MTRRRLQSGNAGLEFALVLLPMFFLMLSIEETGRAMWCYQTLSSAVKRGVRFAAVHGSECADVSVACQVSIAGIVGTIQRSAIGLDSSQLQVALTQGTLTQECNPVTNCASNATLWPSAPNNAVGQPLTIQAEYQFQPIISILWPGQSFGPFPLSTRSTEMIQF